MWDLFALHNVLSHYYQQTRLDVTADRYVALRCVTHGWRRLITAGAG